MAQTQLIVMLTWHDVTVQNAKEIFLEARDAPAKYWGFKDVGIDPEQMSPREKQMLNDYHKKVYEVLSPYMTEEENEWLKKYTRAI